MLELQAHRRPSISMAYEETFDLNTSDVLPCYIYIALLNWTKNNSQ